MKASQFLIATLRENPGDAVIISHKLMLRAGLVRKLGSGLYHLLPLGLRSFRKIENIIREEMNRSGALEFQLPILTPAEIWETSGRWNTMGKEMFRISDRHNVWNVLGPTHEESFTELVKGLISSYRDLPVNVYQIHTKFRDEIRPRYGVIRSREFVMKDAYSFHTDDASLDETYQEMRHAYRRIFARLGLKVLPVEADSGTMGGSGSEEFMVPSEIGEETLLLSESESYRGNQEKTPVQYKNALSETELQKAASEFSAESLKEVHTPNCRTIADVAAFFKVKENEVLKTVLYKADGKITAVVIRGDRDVNEVKLKNHLDVQELETASDEDFRSVGSVPGFIGPFGLKGEVTVLFDSSTATGTSWITGANKKDFHVSGYAVPADAKRIDLASAVAGDPAPNGDGVLSEVKGIEVGHIFKLGNKYTKAFNVNVLDEKGRSVTPVMGCYGIGVNRTLAAVIEQNSTEDGIVWPLSAAPFEMVLVSIAKKAEDIAKIEGLYQSLLKSGADILWDDRDERPGVKFSDADLIGFPVRITAGKTFIESGSVEIQVQGSAEKQLLSGSTEEITEKILTIRNALQKSLDDQAAAALARN